MIAEVFRGGVETDDRKVAADREQDDTRAVAAERRIELQGAGEHLGAEERPGTVADNDDFIGVAFARDLDEVLCKAVDARVPIGACAVGEFPGPDRVAQQIEQVGLVFGIFQHGAEDRNEHRDRRRNTEQIRHAECANSLLERKSQCRCTHRFQQQQQMRVGDEGGKAPVGAPEPGDGAGEHQPPIDPHRLQHGAPDRRGQVALDEVFETQES